VVNDIFLAISDLTGCLEAHRINYLIGGSISSSLSGVYRATNDVDVLVGKPLHLVPEVINSLTKKFFVDELALVQHHKALKAYNIFHEATALKFDLFPAINEFHRSQLVRAITVTPTNSPSGFKIATPEDIVLAKLVWSQHSASERQTADIEGVLNLNRASIDLIYFKTWAERLGVQEQLENFLKRQGQ